MSARVVLSFTTVTLLVFVLAACVWAQPRDPRPPLGPSPAAPATVLPPPPPPPSPPAAVVNGRVVTEEEATRFAWTQMGRQILEGVIDQILIRQAANAAGLKVSSEEVTKRIASLAIEAGNTEKLIAQRGVAGLAALRTQIETEILLEKLVENASKVTEEEARVYYEAHLAEYSTPTQIHLFEIVTQEAETAYQSRRRIASGEAFGTVAKETSAAASAANGGDLGWVTLEQVEPPALRPVVATLTVGEVSTPILANGTFYIVMVSEKKAGDTKSYESVRDEIRAKLR
ncbi:MAG: peptidyl-prolyl cis-trans isomerase, partial [Armatimonadota bacterium]